MSQKTLAPQQCRSHGAITQSTSSSFNFLLLSRTQTSSRVKEVTFSESNMISGEQIQTPPPLLRLPAPTLVFFVRLE